MKSSSRHFMGRLLLALVALMPAAPALAVAQEGGGSYTIGVVPQFDARRILQAWQPILDEVELATGIRLQLVGSPSIPAFEGELAQGKYDFAYMNPYHLLRANSEQGYLPLLKERNKRLQGILVVRKDSGVRAPEELAGKVVVFPAPNALGASLLMRSELQGRRNIAIEPRYVNSHTSVYLNVATGLAEAGGGVQKTLDQQPEEIKGKLRVLYRTVQVASHPIAVHPRVPAAVAQQVQRVFLELGASERGRGMLDEIPMPAPGVAKLAEYQPLANMGLESFYVKE